MGLNCKPGQRAWISIPQTQQYKAIGLTLIDGHVVQTIQLHPRSQPSDPIWIVDPPQSTVAPRTFMSQYGVVHAGGKLHLDGVPDRFLRPFDDIPPEDLQEREHERELIAERLDLPRLRLHR